MILIDIIIVLVILAMINKIWRVENRKSMVFTTLILIAISQLRQNIPGAVYLYYTGYFSEYYYVLIIYGAFLSFLLGYMFFLSGRERKMRMSFEAFKDVNFNLSPKVQRSYLIATISLSIILTLAGLLLYGGLPPVFDAIVSIVRGEIIGFEEVGAARKEITKGHLFGGEYKGQGVLRLITRYGWAFAFGIAYVGFISSRSKLWLILTIAVFILSFIFITGDGTRAPFIQFLLFIFILISFVHRLSKRFVIYGLSIVFGVLIGLSLLSPKLAVYRGDKNFYKMAFQTIAERIVLGNSINDIHAMQEHDKGTVPFRYGGLHLRDITAALPGQQGEVPFAYELFRMKNPYSANSTTYYTGTYFTKTFVDFGVPGTLIIYFALGFVIAFYQKKIYALRNTPSQFVFGLMMITLLGTTTEVGPIGLLASLVVILLMNGIISIFKRITF